MSSTAIAIDYIASPRSAVPRLDRRKRGRITALHPLADVSIAAALELRPAGPPRSVVYVSLLAVAAIVVHAGLFWFVTHFTAKPAAVAQKHEVAVELVRPPKPLEPKIEPPKPVKQVLKQPAKALPQIQTATPEPAVVAEPVASEAPVAVAPIVSAPPAPVEEPVTEPVGRAGYLDNPPPDYPAAAVRQHWEGTVVLRVRVLSTGRVESVEVKESSGRRILDEQAARTVKNWVFTPSKRGPTPVDGWATVPIEFSLES
jgi:protein TonB